MPDQPVCVVVSDHAVVAHGLAAMLHPAAARVDVTVGVLREAVAPDAEVLVYDVGRLAVRGPGELDDLIATGVPVVVVVSDLRPDLHAEAVLGRRVGLVQQTMNSSDVVDVVFAAAAGELRGIPVHLAGEPDVTLSAREAQVLGLIAQGRSNAEIARDLFLSINSVKTYIRTLYRKIGAHRRSQAVIWAANRRYPINELPDSPAGTDDPH